MGAADVAPGVSGGTMAFILGIYRRLIEAIRAFDATLVRLLLARRFRDAAGHVDLALIVPLAIGIFAALMFFTRVVPLPRLIETHPALVYGLFFGADRRLDRGAAPIPGGDPTGGMGRDPGRGRGGFRDRQPRAGIDAGCTLVRRIERGAGDLGHAPARDLRLVHPADPAQVRYVFDGIGRLDPGVIIPFGIGVVLGLMAFSRLLAWLLRKWQRVTLLAICGVLIGSLWMVWPFQERRFEIVRGKRRLMESEPVWPDAADETTLGAFALMAAGLALVAVLHRLARRHGGAPQRL